MKTYNNDIYENLGLSANDQDKMVNNMAKAIESSEKAGTNDIRRMKSMRKNTDSKIIKKVTVASVSIGLSAALIAGVISYNKNNSNTSTSVAKESMKTTEKVTEVATRKASISDHRKNNEEEIDDYNNEINEYSTDKTFKIISFYDCTGITKRAKIGNNLVEIFCKQQYKGGYEINVKQGKNKFVTADAINISKYNFLDFYAYGNDMYYFDSKGLKKLDLESLKAEYVMNFIDVKLATTNQTIFAIDDDYVYMSCVTGNPGDSKDDTTWTGQQNYMYSYNLKDKDLNLLENRNFEAMINDTYIVTSDAHEFTTEQGLEKVYLPLYVEKIEDGKVTTITKLGDYANADYAPPEDYETIDMHVTDSGKVLIEHNGIPYCDETLNRIQFSSASKDKFYYEDFESVDKNNAVDYTKVTIKSYDLKTNKIEKVATISLKDCNISEKDASFVAVLLITDDYCLIDTLVNDKTTGDTKKIKYYFKDKKIENYEY